MADDFLWRHLKEVPAFRGLLRAVEARLYQDLLPLSEPVLDVGCGDGHFASIAFPNPLTTGIDPAASVLREARRQGAHRLVVQAVGDALPYADGSFSTIVSNSVLEHIPDVDTVLAEIARVLQGPEPVLGSAREVLGSAREVLGSAREVLGSARRLGGPETRSYGDPGAAAGRPGGRFLFCVPSDRFAQLLFFSQLFRQLRLEGMARAYERYFNRISQHHHCDGPAIWQARLERAGLRIIRCVGYFSARAHHALDLGHYFGAPSLVAKKLFGHWILVPQRWNLALTERWLRPLYEESLPEGYSGSPEACAYLFVVAEKC